MDPLNQKKTVVFFTRHSFRNKRVVNRFIQQPHSAFRGNLLIRLKNPASCGCGGN